MHHQCAALLAWHSLSLHACKRAAKKATPVQCALVMVPKSERTRANCVHVKYCQCMPLRLGNVSLTMHAEAAGMALRVVNTPGLRLASKSRSACSSTKHMLVIDLLQIVSSRQQTLPRMRLRDLHVGARL